MGIVYDTLMKPDGSIQIGDMEITAKELDAFRTCRDWKILRKAMRG